jgi:exosome complex RNA-binding protein Csl4
MNIPAEVREKAPQEELKNLEAYVKKVKNTLEAMKPGDVIVIANVTKQRSRDLFIEVAKWYMREHRDTYMDGLSFTKGFVSIQKFDVTPLKKRFKKAIL